MFQGPPNPGSDLDGIEDSYFVSRSCEFSSSRFPTSLPIPEMKGGEVCLEPLQVDFALLHLPLPQSNNFPGPVASGEKKLGLNIPTCRIVGLQKRQSDLDRFPGLIYSQEKALLFPELTLS